MRRIPDVHANNWCGDEVILEVDTPGTEDKAMRRGALLTLTILLVAGLMTTSCARRLVGSPIKKDKISEIVAGKTTRADIFRLF